MLFSYLLLNLLNWLKLNVIYRVLLARLFEGKFVGVIKYFEQKLLKGEERFFIDFQAEFKLWKIQFTFTDPKENSSSFLRH